MLTEYYIRKYYNKGVKVDKLPIESITVASDSGLGFSFTTLSPAHFKPDKGTLFICYGTSLCRMELQTVGFIANNWDRL